MIHAEPHPEGGAPRKVKKMAGAGEVTSEFLKNAVVLDPTAKHTATVQL